MTLPNDTLVCDTAQLAYWKNNPAFDYEKELIAPDHNVLDWLAYLYLKLMRAIFGNVFADKYSDLFFIILFMVAIGLVGWFIYRKKPELFLRNKKVATPYDVHEDNIHGVDFEAEISKAISRNDYKNAVRLVYLQTLKYLSDQNLINWQLYKTPTEYTYEIQPDRLRPTFRDLTHRFLRVRYGNYEADKQLFDEMIALQETIGKEVQFERK